MMELGLLCSPNLAFSDCSVSPTYMVSHSSQLILYTGPTTFSFPLELLGEPTADAYKIICIYTKLYIKLSVRNVKPHILVKPNSN